MSKNNPYVHSQKHVILSPQGLNRLLRPLITKNKSFVMFIKTGEKLCRKTFDMYILKNKLF